LFFSEEKEPKDFYSVVARAPSLGVGGLWRAPEIMTIA
jgi:hypothetical protein